MHHVGGISCSAHMEHVGSKEMDGATKEGPSGSRCPVDHVQDWSLLYENRGFIYGRISA